MNSQLNNSIPFAILLGCLFTQGARSQESAPIRDNSFFVEEAFNQETGVVQHISNLTTDSRFSNYVYTFTQEWPVVSEKHQLSYTIPLLIYAGDFRVGDILLNYRYQLVQQNNLYFAPRISAILPTGKRNDGNAASGFQINLPLSYEWKNAIAFHLNAGTTHLWRKTDESHQYSMLLNYSGSAIWLINPHINLMTEVVYSALYRNGEVDYVPGESLILNPGLRGAINFKSGLQIVPGFSAWFDVLNDVNGFFFYVSFEHPFQKTD